MGADLYIESVFNRKYEALRPELDRLSKAMSKARGEGDYERAEEIRKEYATLCDEIWTEENGYFRDSYNVTSILWRLGLSWWTDIGPMLDDEGYLHPKEIRELLAYVESTELNLPTREELEENYAKVDNDENSVESWHQYYIEKKDRFVRFLKRALELNEPIRCSI